MPKLYVAAAAAGTIALSLQAAAQPISGLYIAAGVGANVMTDQPIDRTTLVGVNTSRFRHTSFDTGFATLASLGWGFGNGLRVEIEGNYRQNGIDRIQGATTSAGQELKYGAMLNAFYDLDMGWPVTPYIGIGVGEQTINWHNGSATGPNDFIRWQHEDIAVAYQAILGASYSLPVSGLALTAEYRFLGSTGHTVYGQYFAPNLAKPAETRLSDDFNHSIMFGLRYAFNAAPPAPLSRPAASAPAPADSRTYLVFFDWDRADLTDRARQVIAEAAHASTRVRTTRIEVSGHADRSGTRTYNVRLSARRAAVVAAELVRLGVPTDDIATRGFGDTRPLIQTVAGIREAQNRRVEIVLR